MHADDREAEKDACEKSSDDDDIVFDLTQDDDEDNDNNNKPPKKSTINMNDSSSSDNNKKDNDDDDDDDDNDDEDNDNDCDLLNLSPVFIRRSNTLVSSLSSSSSSLSTRTTSATRTTTMTSTTSTSFHTHKEPPNNNNNNTKRKRSNNNNNNNTHEKQLSKKEAAQQKKAQRAKEREEAKRQKQQKQQREKEKKAEMKQREEQADGKYAFREICVLFTLDVSSNRDGYEMMRNEGNGGKNCLGKVLLENLKEMEYLYGFIFTGEQQQQQQYQQSLRRRDVCGGKRCICIRWVRKDFLRGGAKSAALTINGCTFPDDAKTANDTNNTAGNIASSIHSSLINNIAAGENNNTSSSDVQRMDIVSFLFYDPGVFLDLLERDSNAEMRDDYPKIRAWLRGIRTVLQEDWEENVGGGEDGAAAATVPSRIILVLHNVQYELNRRWNERNNAGRGRGRGRNRTAVPAPSTPAGRAAVLINEEELHDAIAWLLMEQNVECTLTSNVDDTVQYIVGVTKALSQLPYYEEATELQCVRKLKPDADATTPFEKARDCWRRQLRQIPMVSEAKAGKLVEKFPTARSLMDVYDDPSYTEEQKRTLLASCMDDGRNHFKMSDCIYRLMTSSDPNEII